MKNYKLYSAVLGDRDCIRYLNIHPEGKLVGDCVKRAIALAADLPYRDIKIALNRYKKVTGAKKFNSKENDIPFILNELKADKLSFPAKAGEPRMNGERFCKAYPKGNYILRMAGHLSCCIDGVIYDTWDCSQKCVYNAFKIGGK